MSYQEGGRRQFAALAQGLKKEAVSGPPYRVVTLSFSEAAWDFGIGVARLLDLAKQGHSLVIQPDEATQTVIIQLIKSAPDPRRDLWREVLDTLEAGRSRHGQIRDAYELLYAFLRWNDEMGGRNPNLFLDRTARLGKPLPLLLRTPQFEIMWAAFLGDSPPDEDTLQILAVAAYAFFGCLERGMQQDLISNMPPFLLRTSAGERERVD